ncbi:hypothetical protein F0L68_31340 [Solihabitans fulvus]|uniref:Uncharacterized protein n=1 Tax=Solihabitans fulvus TaxID=1892852 RepID=A0A5B2WTS6_9PSEU|nr:hypothetical protein [Solihabitans fulvus]KAA2254102.1 hypothetical protein F0L68_31340 [Solihabitans fulvus]
MDSGADRNDVWLPLLLSGLVVLGVRLAAGTTGPPPGGPHSADRLVAAVAVSHGPPTDPFHILAGWPAGSPSASGYWLLGALVLLVGTALWYARRAENRRRPLGFAALGLAGLVGGLPVLTYLDGVRSGDAYGGTLVTSVAGAVAALGACLLGWTQLRPPGSTLATRLGVACLACGGTTFALMSIVDLRPALLLTVALLALAWLRRSALCAVTALLFAAAALWLRAAGVEVPAVVLLTGGAVGLLRWLRPRWAGAR